MVTTPAGAQDKMPDYTGNKCIECHEGLDGNLGKAVADWRQSTHARQGIACDGCHGGVVDSDVMAHSPASGFVGVPRIREVPYFCGKCHEDIKERHLGSPHGAQGLPNCATCHGHHTIGPPDPMEIINVDACTKCHPFEPAAKALEALNKGRELLAELQDMAGKISHIPGVEEQLEIVQEEMKLDKQGIVTTFHSFRIGSIEQIGLNVDRLKKTLSRLREREEQRQENLSREIPLILTLMVFLLFASILGFMVYHGKGTVEPSK